MRGCNSTLVTFTVLSGCVSGRCGEWYDSVGAAFRICNARFSSIIHIFRSIATLIRLTLLSRTVDVCGCGECSVSSIIC